MHIYTMYIVYYTSRLNYKHIVCTYMYVHVWTALPVRHSLLNSWLNALMQAGTGAYNMLSSVLG